MEPSIHDIDYEVDPIHRHTTPTAKWVTVPGFNYQSHNVIGHQLAVEALPFMYPKHMGSKHFVRCAPKSEDLKQCDGGDLCAFQDKEARVLPAFMYT